MWNPFKNLFKKENENVKEIRSLIRFNQKCIDKYSEDLQWISSLRSDVPYPPEKHLHPLEMRYESDMKWIQLFVDYESYLKIIDLVEHSYKKQIKICEENLEGIKEKLKEAGVNV